MDNNFYNRNTERKRTTPKEKQKNAMTKVIVVQLVLSLTVTGILFAVSKTDTSLSKGIKDFYAKICETDIAVSSIIDVFKGVVKETFSPIKGSENQTGDTKEESGEKVDFSPVFLTVNLSSPLKTGKITSNFGYRISPIDNEYSLHKGIDIATDEKEKIYASYDGVVKKSEYHYINGNYIVLEHSDALLTTYNHCSKLLVKTGDRVRRGECIALVGSTGYATGSHLHYEVIVNNKHINPLWVILYDI